MSDIELVDICKHNCRNVHLKILDRELFVIVGPTGAGKTTLLNIIAGVVDYTGSVWMDGVNVDRVSPGRRGVGYLFQELALFPHLTVESNIAFGLMAEGVEKRVAHERVASLMDMMRIRHLAGRYPHTLSGGEKKRVALARSLAPSPKVLLLDEPTSSLDHQTAKYLRSELVSVIRRLGITTVHVTHDLREAEEMADRIAFMSNGGIEQISTPQGLFFNPLNEAVSEFIGMPNILECKQSRVLASGLVEVASDDIRMVLPYDGNGIKRIAIPPDDIYLSNARPPGPALNRFIGTVEEITEYHSTVRVRLSVGKTSLLAELPVSAFNELCLEKGKGVHVVIKLRRLRYVES
ncbi:MAG: ABC transporter ATP-binding protein [Deltaproteobacteria bacterium]|nr:ABC transporter ATP-binding protein [Deltaproteobacteria bacterium]